MSSLIEIAQQVVAEPGRPRLAMDSALPLARALLDLTEAVEAERAFGRPAEWDDPALWDEMRRRRDRVGAVLARIKGEK